MVIHLVIRWVVCSYHACTREEKAGDQNFYVGKSEALKSVVIFNSSISHHLIAEKGPKKQLQEQSGEEQSRYLDHVNS